MRRHVFAALATSALVTMPAVAGPLSLDPRHHVGATPSAAAFAAPVPMPTVEPAAPVPVRYAAAERGRMGGGFIEFIFGGGPPPRAYNPPVARPEPQQPSYPLQPVYARTEPREYSNPARPAMDPKYMRQVVRYEGREKPGTIIVDTPNRFLYLVLHGGRALRYGIGVGRPGFTWAGVKTITAKKEWPDWVPPPEMLKRRPDLPHFMAGGPDNPLGARALYLGSSLYRIHGSNEPWTIGQAVSSGCIRMRNEDVIDLYDRVKVGTKVVVI